MQGLFIDGGTELGNVFTRIKTATDPDIRVNPAAHVEPHELAALLRGQTIVLNDHTFMPTDAMRACPDVRHVIFLGTGARSYMNIEELAELGITVHIIRGYADTAVAEHTIALMWAGARNIARMDRDVRTGQWTRSEGLQLTGKTLGLVGFGGIAAEVARIAVGSGMKVLAWNRSPKTAPGVTFTDLDTVLAESHVVSMHLLLTDETRGIISAEKIARMRPGVLLVNTARGALVDEGALLAALGSGQVGHAALDVFGVEPLPAGHPFTRLPNVTLTAHSAFRTPEANEALITHALEIARTIIVK